MDRRHPRKPPAQPLVLLVEAHQDTRALYALALSAMGFEVVALPDRTEAFCRAWEIHPDIIVTDLPLPNDGGGQFVQELKQNPRTRDIPLVAVSGYVERSCRDRAMDGGFAAFFAKPCLPDALAAGLWRLLDEGSMRTSSTDGATNDVRSAAGTP
jgi:two-component system, cell cycle response regulator DivK